MLSLIDCSGLHWKYSIAIKESVNYLFIFIYTFESWIPYNTQGIYTQTIVWNNNPGRGKVLKPSAGVSI